MHSLSILLLSLPFLPGHVLADTLQSVISAYSLTAASYNFSVPTTTLNSDDAAQWIVSKWDATGGKLDFGENDVCVFHLSQLVFETLLTAQCLLSGPGKYFGHRRQAPRGRDGPYLRRILDGLDQSQLVHFPVHLEISDRFSHLAIIHKPVGPASGTEGRIPSGILFEKDGRNAVHLKFDDVGRRQCWRV